MCVCAGLSNNRLEIAMPSRCILPSSWGGGGGGVWRGGELTSGVPYLKQDIEAWGEPGGKLYVRRAYAHTFVLACDV